MYWYGFNGLLGEFKRISNFIEPYSAHEHEHDIKIF